jgi:hypothetical protein
MMGLSLQCALARVGWRTSVSLTYPIGAAAAVDAIGEGTLVVDND